MIESLVGLVAVLLFLATASYLGRLLARPERLDGAWLTCSRCSHRFLPWPGRTCLACGGSPVDEAA